VRRADNLPPSCADVKKSGKLNFLEPCGPVQACDGTALPLLLPLLLRSIITVLLSTICFSSSYEPSSG
jgi:hypothetical protein